MPRASPRKRAAVNYAETEVKQETPQSKGTTTKRKVDPEDEPAAAPSTSAKKRKTKAKAKDSDEDAMPLAERTTIAALKKPMYIGAHVSAAGG